MALESRLEYRVSRCATAGANDVDCTLEDGRLIVCIILRATIIVFAELIKVYLTATATTRERSSPLFA